MLVSSYASQHSTSFAGATPWLGQEDSEKTMRAEPISCYRPTPDRVATFASLPYDVFDRDQAASYVRAHPGSFLTIDRPETAFPPHHDMYAPEVYAKAAQILRLRVDDGTLVRDTLPCYYLYRLEQDGHTQTGIVCACSIDEYEDGTIRRHESTTAAKEADRIEHIRVTGAQTGPILLAYPDDPTLDRLVRQGSGAAPLYDFTDDGGVRQTVWRIALAATVEAIRRAFSSIEHAYIADGHHRAASAAKLGLMMRAQKRAGYEKGESLSDLFLAVLFPAGQLRLLAYNRVVSDLAGRTPAELLAAIADAGFSVGAPSASATPPRGRRRFCLYLGGSWRDLEFVDVSSLPDDPVSRLDAQILQDRILGPILGIDDPRTSERVRFIGDIEGAGRLEELAGAHGVAFSLFPTSIDELMAVSDTGRLMPPKSTWFEPKLRSGLFIRKIREDAG